MSNRVNFTGQSRFPLSIETMDFLQTMIRHNAILSNIGGVNYILTGCEENGANVAPGYVVINGELLPFTGGIKQINIYIKEVKRSVIASGYNFPDIYTTRTAEFGVGTPQLQWDSFKRIKTNFDLEALINKLQEQVDELQGIPVGARIGWVGFLDKIPTGYMLCDGRVLSVAEYPKLYDVIGNMYGGVTGVSFQLPVMGGRFIVGHNVNDDDYNAIGKVGGFKEITLNIDQIPSHTHKIKESNADNGDPGDYATTASSQPNVGMYTDPIGGGKAHENRPPYFVEGYIIKAK